ncbi:uroporphyrinogen decarboxylase [Candidatus Rhodoluna planktonica]|uniref:Uroporphyrinogen decarboxylase n=1 Tax=Candidatus Rhodoluna planktonica TaxID=535712 RepID=A0A1D9E0K2_9MICO|nr:uroporphyrinogen decarboxylase [Candidatus Rhodoluna planktonica]AOY56587.1 uroporphyrinogen decarboxylase [Candidatus Rhodoluna planktonica]
MTLSPLHPLNAGLTDNSALISNLRGRRTSPLPIWFMRQAGRSLPEYRKLREGIPMLDSCLNPDLVVEITLQPVRRHNVDAAIFFSDIVIPLKLAGIDVDIKAGVGPVITRPIATKAQVEELRLIPVEAFSPIVKSVERLVAELGKTPLIAFGGAPFTLASYLIEGGPSKDLPKSRSMMRNEPELWARILKWCADVTAQFIVAQVEAGASALQVFDSWAGRLTEAEYREFAMPYSQRLFDQLQQLVDSTGQPVPRIHFGVGTKSILKDMHQVGATVIGVDSATSLAEASELLGGEVAVQGNIDTDRLTDDWIDLEQHLREVIADGESAIGHVVNLGHGVPAETNPEVLTKIVEFVHAHTS